MKEIRLSEEMFLGLLQGKKLEYVTHRGMEQEQSRLVIYPPHYGLYLTHSQIAELQRAARMEGSRELIELMDKFTTA